MTTRYRRFVTLGRRVESTLPDRAVVGGAIATAIATYVLFALPSMVPFPEFRRELHDSVGFYFLQNPFPSLQFLGGIVGGYVAGYLTRHRWYTAMVNGIQAVVLGMSVFYLGVVLDGLARFLVAGMLDGSVVLVVVLQPLIFTLIPFSLLYFFQSLLVSPVGNFVSNGLDGWFPSTVSGDGSVASEPNTAALRAVASVLVFIVLFSSVWWFVFFFQARY